MSYQKYLKRWLEAQVIDSEIEQRILAFESSQPNDDFRPHWIQNFGWFVVVTGLLTWILFSNKENLLNTQLIIFVLFSFITFFSLELFRDQTFVPGVHIEMSRIFIFIFSPIVYTMVFNKHMGSLSIFLLALSTLPVLKGSKFSLSSFFWIIIFLSFLFSLLPSPHQTHFLIIALSFFSSLWVLMPWICRYIGSYTLFNVTSFFFYLFIFIFFCCNGLILDHQNFSVHIPGLTSSSFLIFFMTPVLALLSFFFLRFFSKSRQHLLMLYVLLLFSYALFQVPEGRLPVFLPILQALTSLIAFIVMADLVQLKHASKTLTYFFFASAQVYLYFMFFSKTSGFWDETLKIVGAGLLIMFSSRPIFRALLFLEQMLQKHTSEPLNHSLADDGKKIFKGAGVYPMLERALVFLPTVVGVVSYCVLLFR